MCNYNLFDYITGEDTGGVWTQTGGTTIPSLVPTAVVFTGLTAGTYSFTYTVGTGACASSTQISFIVVDPLNAGTYPDLTVCSEDTVIVLPADNGGDTGGSWAGVPLFPSGAGSTIGGTSAFSKVLEAGDEGTYVITYSIINLAADVSCIDCHSEASFTLTVTAAANSGTALPTITVCN